MKPLCEYAGTCVFYNVHKYTLSEREYQMFVSSYCNGTLQSMCQRIKFQREKDDEPPLGLCPNGYRVGSYQRLH